MISSFQIVSIFIGTVYFSACFWLCWHWYKMPVFEVSSIQKVPFISIVIPIRNEAENILFLLQDIDNQSIDKNTFEVIVANDNSTDASETIVSNFKPSYALRVVNLTNEPHSSPKKRAIRQALQVAQGELIVTTDGDCRVGKNWLSTIAQFQVQTQAKLISGGVVITPKQEGWPEGRKVLERFFGIFQTIEFSSLIGTGGVCMAQKRPNMCNGANLAYLKTAFEVVGGFSGNDHLASGDDEFLMHKIFQKFPNDVHFLKNHEAVVHTQSHSSGQSFYQQRRRWASKWRHYESWQTSALAIFVFLVNLFLIASLLSAWYSWFFIVLKCSAEFVFLAMLIHFFKKSRLILFIPLVQIVYPFYVVLFGLLAQGKGYQWKGRRLQ